MGFKKASLVCGTCARTHSRVSKYRAHAWEGARLLVAICMGFLRAPARCYWRWRCQVKAPACFDVPWEAARAHQANFLPALLVRDGGCRIGDESRPPYSMIPIRVTWTSPCRLAGLPASRKNGGNLLRPRCRLCVISQGLAAPR